MKTNEGDYWALIQFYKDKKESKLKTAIKHETNEIRRNTLQKVYDFLKREKLFKK